MDWVGQLILTYYPMMQTMFQGHQSCGSCKEGLSSSYTMGCPPVRGDNPRALASGLSYVQVDKHGITILYHQHQCRPCTSRDSSC